MSIFTPCNNSPSPAPGALRYYINVMPSEAGIMHFEKCIMPWFSCEHAQNIPWNLYYPVQKLAPVEKQLKHLQTLYRHFPYGGVIQNSYNA
jgi:hypothetical protein